MTDTLLDKVAIVTGSGRGIGRGVAMLMAEEGAKVVVVDPGVNVDGSGQDQSVAEQVVAEIKAAGGQAVACTESGPPPDQSRPFHRQSADGRRGIRHRFQPGTPHSHRAPSHGRHQCFQCAYRGHRIRHV